MAFKELFYGKGYVNGSVAYDSVSTNGEPNKAVKVKLLAVDAAEDLEGTKADGILGLSPTELVPETSFVKQLYDQKLIPHMSFGVFLGDENEQSYIEFGVLERNETNRTEPIWTKVLSA